MDVAIRQATLNDIQKVQELNLKLFEKEQKEYDHLLDMNWTFSAAGTKYYQDRISQDDGCVLVAIVEKSLATYVAD